MEKRILQMLLLVMSLTAGAQGFTEITSEALLNPSFELSAEGTAYTAAIAKTVTEVYGWDIPTPQEQSIADESSTEVGFTNNAGGVVASEGKFFFWNRKGWGSASGTLSTTTNVLEPGKYYVVFDYKAADYSNNNTHSQSGTTMQLTVSTEDGETLVQTTSAKRSFSIVNNNSNPGANTYLKDSPWVPMGTLFTLETGGKVVISVKQNLKNNGRSDVCYDNFRLYRVYDSGAASDATPLPLDITGALANPSFEAGGSGNDWQQYSYNGWSVAKTGGEIKATSEASYIAVFGDYLHGLRIFNAWDNSTTNSKKLSQSVSGLPLGKYRLSATVAGYAGQSFSLFAGDESKTITIASQEAVQTETLEFTKAKASAIDIGIDSKVFFKADNFRLEYLGYDEDIQEEESDQVKTAVRITTAIDYTIAAAETPFTTTGSVDICNDQATVIFTQLKPSVVIAQWLTFVMVNGAPAVNGVNCQVRMYNNGSIILPYGDDCQPLTVYSGMGQTGDSSSQFGLENTGGYMNTMTEEQLNNRVCSFRLKRGYMVTFSLRPEGRGYSRCFIADKEDLVMDLPILMADRVSSYRIFKWNNASKKGIASTTDQSVIGKINASWCYTWGVGSDRGPDTECVPHHLYEDWPSSSACGSVTYSPHMKTNNEPLNTADDHPQNLTTILNNWENLMRTGMRLCSPSSWDGSPNFMAQFLDSIDARGWRCDIADLHCYWAEDTYYTLSSLHNRYKRPIWISEFLWGASWNSNGVFASKSTSENRTVMGRILDRLNAWGYIERYAYWNSEAWYSRIVNTDDGWVTPLGVYYRDMDTGLGYNSDYEFVPKAPRQYSPTNLAGKYNPEAEVVTLTWDDQNGELNQRMTVERLDGSTWTTVYTVSTPEDGPASYSCDIRNANVGDQYRVHVVDLNGTHRYTAIYTVPFTISKEGRPGLEVNLQGTTYYLGGNLIENGDFDYGLDGWQNGTGSNATWPNFKANDVAGVDNGAYVQAYAHTGREAAGSLRRAVDIDPNATYFFSVYSKNNDGGYQMASLSADGNAETEVVNNLSATTDWTLDGSVFDSKDNPYFIIRYRWLGSKAQFDRFYLGRLFATRDEAMADAVEQVKKEAALFQKWNTAFPYLNTELQGIVSRNRGGDEQTLLVLQEALAAARTGMREATAVDSLLRVADVVREFGFVGQETLQQAIEEAQLAQTAEEYAWQHEALQRALDDYMAATEVTSLIMSPTFDGTSTGWDAPGGSYQGGDQRLNTWEGRTCWNAWWSVASSDAGSKTLGVSQTIENLPMGYYSVSADAATQHYCLSDQHSFVGNGSVVQQSPVLTIDRADVPDVESADIWAELRTAPVYVDEGGWAVIGFESSKSGATEGAYGVDQREGWWLATNFRLWFTPAYERQTTAGTWETLCLPFAAQCGEGIVAYTVLGRTADAKNLVLSESRELQAGRPYIVFTENERMVFRGNGTQREEQPLPGDNGLTGLYVDTEGSVPEDAFVLADGVWRKREEVPDHVMGNYRAYLADVLSLPVVNTEGYQTLPIDGVEVIPEGIDVVDEASTQEPAFSVDGRRMGEARGLHIRGSKKYVKK